MQRVNLGIAILCMVNNTAVNAIYQNEKQSSFINTSIEASLENNYTKSGCHAILEDSKTAPDGEFVWSKKLQGLLLASFFYGKNTGIS